MDHPWPGRTLSRIWSLGSSKYAMLLWAEARFNYNNATARRSCGTRSCEGASEFQELLGIWMDDPLAEWWCWELFTPGAKNAKVISSPAMDPGDRKLPTRQGVLQEPSKLWAVSDFITKAKYSRSSWKSNPDRKENFAVVANPCTAWKRNRSTPGQRPRFRRLTRASRAMQPQISSQPIDLETFVARAISCSAELSHQGWIGKSSRNISALRCGFAN